MARIISRTKYPKTFSLSRGSGLKFVIVGDVSQCAAFSLSRGSGLKFDVSHSESGLHSVLPLTREWIEIINSIVLIMKLTVLPLTREWIEMPIWRRLYTLFRRFSLSRGSGLKSLPRSRHCRGRKVLPLTREWIEISSAMPRSAPSCCSPSHEGVD